MSEERERMAQQLREHGVRRRRALDEADRELTALVPLIPKALELGLTKVEVAKLTGLGRPTIDRVLARRV